jgi:hypothetical protein
MWKFLFLTLVLVYLLIPPAGATVTCVDPTQLLGNLQKIQPATKVDRELIGEPAQRFMEKWNNFPPPTNIQADLVQVFTRPGYPVDLLVLFNKGCMQSAYQIRSRVLRRLIPLPLNFNI